MSARDVVWVLGDFAWTPRAAAQALRQLNGRIRLVLGDHDARWLAVGASGSDDKLPLDAVAEVHGAVKWRPGVLLTHVPAVPGPKYRVNLHGHTHSRRVEEAGLRETPRDVSPSLAHLCVSVEQTSLAPVSWDEIDERLRERGLELP